MTDQPRNPPPFSPVSYVQATASLETFAGVICVRGEYFVPPGSLPNDGQSLGPLAISVATESRINAVNSGSRNTRMAHLQEENGSDITTTRRIAVSTS